jgi:hypothetical protein
MKTYPVALTIEYPRKLAKVASIHFRNKNFATKLLDL